MIAFHFELRLASCSVIRVIGKLLTKFRFSRRAPKFAVLSLVSRTTFPFDCYVVPNGLEIAALVCYV